MVPRHELIVARILGNTWAHELTLLIGFSECLMSVWIISGFYPKINAITQITIIICMNILEFLLAPDLLLWGRANLIFAILFSCWIGWNEMHRRRMVLHD
ncbi:MAG: DoxX-like family protein [Chitinophagales bacterium]|nr:DoxX-like family protein [Chitinophagales bacterium]